jgi:hypothetical protein
MTSQGNPFMFHSVPSNSKPSSTPGSPTYPVGQSFSTKFLAANTHGVRRRRSVDDTGDALRVQDMHIDVRMKRPRVDDVIEPFEELSFLHSRKHTLDEPPEDELPLKKIRIDEMDQDTQQETQQVRLYLPDSVKQAIPQHILTGQSKPVIPPSMALVLYRPLKLPDVPEADEMEIG